MLRRSQAIQSTARHLLLKWRNKLVTRREFLDTLAVGAAGLAIGSTAKSYGQILGSNDRLNFAVIGLHSRGYAHLSSLKANKDAARISHVCDVDSNTLKKFAANAEQVLGYAPATDKDFRHILQLKEVDAITIATPDHWHTPMAIAGLQAGKHVYVEKPCSHNPAEGALLVEAQRKYRQAGADGHAAALFPSHHRDRRQDSQRPDRQGLLSPRPGTATRESRSASARKRPCRRSSTGISGRDRRRADPIRTMFIPITGTGSGSGAPAKP